MGCVRHLLGSIASCRVRLAGSSWCGRGRGRGRTHTHTSPYMHIRLCLSARGVSGNAALSRRSRDGEDMRVVFPSLITLSISLFLVGLITLGNVFPWYTYFSLRRQPIS